MSKHEPTAAEIADKLAKRLGKEPSEEFKDVPVSLSISLPKSVVRELEEARLRNKDEGEGPRTLSGLIMVSLRKDGYGQ